MSLLKPLELKFKRKSSILEVWSDSISLGTVEKMKISSTDYSLSIPTYVLAFKQGGTLTENLFRKRCSGRWLLLLFLQQFRILELTD